MEYDHRPSYLRYKNLIGMVHFIYRPPLLPICQFISLHAVIIQKRSKLTLQAIQIENSFLSSAYIIHSGILFNEYHYNEFSSTGLLPFANKRIS